MRQCGWGQDHLIFIFIFAEPDMTYWCPTEVGLVDRCKNKRRSCVALLALHTLDPIAFRNVILRL